MSKIKKETLDDIRSSKPYLITLAAMLLTGLILQIIFSNILGVSRELIPCIFFFSMIPFLIIYSMYIKKGKISYKDIGVITEGILKM